MRSSSRVLLRRRICISDSSRPSFFFSPSFAVSSLSPSFRSSHSSHSSPSSHPSSSCAPPALPCHFSPTAVVMPTSLETVLSWILCSRADQLMSGVARAGGRTRSSASRTELVLLVTHIAFRLRHSSGRTVQLTAACKIRLFK